MLFVYGESEKGNNSPLFYYFKILIRYINKNTMKKFPNEFSCWQETHFEIVQAITMQMSEKQPKGVAADRQEAQGHGGLYELAEELTDEFEKLHEGRIWDGEFFDEIEKFVEEKL